MIRRRLTWTAQMALLFPAALGALLLSWSPAVAAENQNPAVVANAVDAVVDEAREETDDASRDGARHVGALPTGDPRGALREANLAFQSGDYGLAARRYQAILDSGIVNEDLLFNLGTAELRSGKRGRAILAFERALRLAPGDADVAYNLAEARRGNIDKIVGERVEASLLERLGSRLPLEPIGYSFVATWILSFGLFALLRFRRSTRAALSAMAGLSATAALVSGSLLAAGAWAHSRGVDAVVIASSAKVREGPASGFKVAFEIHEGSTVRIVGEDGDFARIRLPNGLEGWVEANQVPAI